MGEATENNRLDSYNNTNKILKTLKWMITKWFLILSPSFFYILTTSNYRQQLVNTSNYPDSYPVAI